MYYAFIKSEVSDEGLICPKKLYGPKESRKLIFWSGKRFIRSEGKFCQGVSEKQLGICF
jgi:hypothetical protein